MLENILQVVGNTPLVKLNKLNQNKSVNVLVKLEGFNPMGSVKDRICLAMVEEAERDYGGIENKILVESSSGNTGIGLAMVCAVREYKLLITMSRKVSIERRQMIRSFGAELVLVEGGSDEAWDEADKIAASDPSKYIRLQQYKTAVNVRVHYETTGPEIYKQTSGKLDILVAPIGTTGTIVGAGKYLKEKLLNVKIIGVEPTPQNIQQGLRNIKTQRVPEIFEPEIVDEYIETTDDESLRTARDLALKEGLFTGISTGSTVAAALRIANKESNKTIVVISPDRGDKYLSTELFGFKDDPVVWSPPYDKNNRNY